MENNEQMIPEQDELTDVQEESIPKQKTLPSTQRIAM